MHESACQKVHVTAGDCAKRANSKEGIQPQSNALGAVLVYHTCCEQHWGMFGQLCTVNRESMLMPINTNNSNGVAQFAVILCVEAHVA